MWEESLFSNNQQFRLFTHVKPYIHTPFTLLLTFQILSILPLAFQILSFFPLAF